MTLNNFLEAVAEKLVGLWPDRHVFVNEIPKDSDGNFFVGIIEATQEKKLDRRRRRHVQIEVLYFLASKDNLDFNEWSEKMLDEFESLTVVETENRSRLVRLTNVTARKDDDSRVYQFLFDAVVIGGIKRIAKVSEIVVPFMAVLYVALGAIIIITNITAVPAALVSIIKSAFTGSALAGGAMGTMVVAMQKGIARGIFSNESGLGSAPIAAAAAKTKEPVRQGLVSMTGTFIDTIVICTMTGLSIVIAGTWMNPELEGVEITVAAFQKGLPFPPIVASFSLMLCLVFFAFTTILGWNYYGERCIEYLFNRNKSVVKGYRWLYILAVFIGPYMTVAAVWNIADIFNALMAFPNLIAILALSGVVVRETKDYFARQKKQSK